MTHKRSEEKLVYMANQIAIFFEHEPDNVAIEAIVKHLHSYWERRMREKIVSLAATSPHGLSARAFAAVKRLEPITTKT